MNRSPKTLLLGWGNPGRQDDGLGPALTRLLETGSIDNVTVDSDYQLQIEDAADIAQHERVIFVDADRSGPEPFSCRRLLPSSAPLSFSSHSVSPAALLALSERLFDHRPEAWLVGVRGYRFDTLEEKLSPAAKENLKAAASYLTSALRSGSLEEIPSTPSEVPHEC